MQKVEGKCRACGGDGLRQIVGVQKWPIGLPECTVCKGTGLQPNPDNRSALRKLLDSHRDAVHF